MSDFRSSDSENAAKVGNGKVSKIIKHKSKLRQNPFGNLRSESLSIHDVLMRWNFEAALGVLTMP